MKQRLNLCLFSEGAEGAEGAPVPVATEQKPAETVVKYGKQPESSSEVTSEDSAKSQPATENQKPSFKDLIETDYKEEFTQFFQEKFNERHKGYKNLEAKINKYESILQMIAGKYGMQEVDADKLLKAIEEDDAMYEQEALDKGMTKEQLKEFKRLEREKDQLYKEKQERDKLEAAAKIQSQWDKESAELKAIYPDFDFKKEIANPKFVGLITNQVDLQTAYMVTHKDEIIKGAVTQTAETVKKAVVDNIKARGSRPNEEGANPSVAVIFKSDPTKLTAEDRAEIRRKVANGEKIYF